LGGGATSLSRSNLAIRRWSVLAWLELVKAYQKQQSWSVTKHTHTHLYLYLLDFFSVLIAAPDYKKCKRKRMRQYAKAYLQRLFPPILSQPSTLCTYSSGSIQIRLRTSNTGSIFRTLTKYGSGIPV
jgi:hypothetical protein